MQDDDKFPVLEFCDPESTLAVGLFQTKGNDLHHVGIQRIPFNNYFLAFHRMNLVTGEALNGWRKRTAATASAGNYIVVVIAAQLRITQRFVGFLDFHKPLCKEGVIVILIRMIFHGKFPVGRLDVLFRSIVLNSQKIIVVLQKLNMVLTKIKIKTEEPIEK